MNDYHKSEFEQIMTICFKNFGKIPDVGLIDMFFERLKSFNIQHVRKAFEMYIEENDKRRGVPCLKDLTVLSKKSASCAYFQLRNEKNSRCYVEGCTAPDDKVEICPYNPNISMCSFHLDEFVLKIMPNSPPAKIIKDGREFSAEAKRLGRTSREHFEALHPEWLERIEKSEGQSRQTVPLKEDRPKSATEIFYESTSKRVVNSDVMLDDDIPF